MLLCPFKATEQEFIESFENIRDMGGWMIKAVMWSANS
jgi:hypothetical protein